MKLNSLINKNKFFTIITILFLIWIIFLTVLTIVGKRTVIFFDALGQIDVSSEFESRLPLLRYFIEPLYAISCFLEYEFTWMFLFLIIYPVLRIIYLLLKKKGKFNSEKFKYLTYPLAEFIFFSFKVLTLLIMVVGLYILIGVIIQGYFFVSRYFMIPLQLAVHFGLILILIKLIYSLIKLFHPKLKLNLSKRFQKRKRNRRITIIKRETIFFIGIGVILLSSNIVLISTPFPPHEIIPTIPLGDDEFLFDFHIHTIYSDGWITVEERINWYIQQGIDGAAFSDHDNIRGATMAQQYVEDHGLNFVILMAEEWTDNENDIHMNYFGLSEEIVPLQSYTPGGPLSLNASDTINYVKSKGGFITVNHYNYENNPNGGFGVPYSLDQLRDWGVDGFEIVNGGSHGWKYQQIRNYCLANNLTCIGGSDIHTNEDLNTFIKLKLDDSTNLTVTNIFETLKKNEHEVIAISFYPKIIEFPEDLNDFGFYFLEDFMNYLLNMDSYQALSWIIWTIFLYTLLFLIYRKIKKTDLTFLKAKIL
jgi:hypothetical protein